MSCINLAGWILGGSIVVGGVFIFLTAREFLKTFYLDEE